MKKIFTLIVIVGILGGGWYMTKDFFSGLIFIDQKEVPNIQSKLPKASIEKKENEIEKKDQEDVFDGLSNTKSSTNGLLETSENILSGVDIEEIINRLEKSLFNYQVETGEYILIKGNISNIKHTQIVDKISVTSCKGNLGSVYGSPYILKSYEYPYFEYKIKQSFNNVCRIPYKIIFYDKNNTEIFTKDLKIPTKETQRIMK